MSTKIFLSFSQKKNFSIGVEYMPLPRAKNKEFFSSAEGGGSNSTTSGNPFILVGTWHAYKKSQNDAVESYVKTMSSLTPNLKK